MDFTDTICAPGSQPGGAISLVRISGSESFTICASVIAFSSGSKDISTLPPNTIHFCEVTDGDQVIDQVLVSLFKNPHSYTGEDMIEISCHGSAYIQTKIIELLIRKGARLAKPGEFTQRAFLNGKMDLSQAEAVADLIASESAAAHKIAIKQMKGGFSSDLKDMRSRLLNLVSMIELELDFGEEEVEFASRKELRELVISLQNHINTLLTSFELGNAIRSGIPVAIVGKPNVGKSTLLNHLLNDDKAIVSEIEGTTRDSIEDTIIIEGVKFRFIDTAGIRETADFIENLGIRRTYQKIDEADIILLLVDASDSPEQITEVFKQIDKQKADQQKRLILLVNKVDKIDETALLSLQSALKSISPVYISAEKKENIDEVIEKLKKAADIAALHESDLIITNTRHFEALQHSSESLGRVINAIDEGLSEDLLTQDIRECLHYLGEITGEVTTDEILGNIFRNFCIGK